MEPNQSLREKINQLATGFPELVLEEQLRRRPDLATLYTERQKELYKGDVAYILSFLGEAVGVKRPELFTEFASWLRTFLLSVHVPPEDVKESFAIILEMLLQAVSPEEAPVVSKFMQNAIGIFEPHVASLPGHPSSHLHTELARVYLDLILEGNRRDAQELILEQVKSGKPVKEIYLDVFQPVQYEIGRLWQTNKITVAQEHYATGVTQLVMSQLYPYLFTGEKKTKKMVSTCISGELHEMGIRMVTDFFEMDGWDTYYLGANTPPGGVIRFLKEVKPELLAISVTMTFHLNEVRNLIRMVRETPELNGKTKVLVGGNPFKVADNLWLEMGADAFASNAEEAVLQAGKI